MDKQPHFWNRHMDANASDDLVGLRTDQLSFAPRYLRRMWHGSYAFRPFRRVLVDRINCKKLLIATQAIQIVFSSALAILALTGLLVYWQLLVITFFNGIITTVTQTAIQALSMDIVGEKNISNAIALNNVAMNVTWAIGPAVGGRSWLRWGRQIVFG